MAEPQLLYLFSSDQTPRYAQDILNILGSPRGHSYRFRYQQRHVEERLHERWIERRLGGARGLVCFASQHPAMYAPAAFIPIRYITVVDTETVGSHLFLHMTLEELVALPLHDDDKQRRSQVRDFGDWLREHTATPYDAWASEGASPAWATEPAPPFEAGGNEDVYFESDASYLSATAAFSTARFVRFLGAVGPDNHRQEALQGTPPALEFEGGATYEIELLQFVPGPLGLGTAFSLVFDETKIKLLGEPKIVVASRYDKPVLRVHAVPPAGRAINETTFVIEPLDGTVGPRLEIPIKVRPSLRHGLAQTAATTVALALLALPAVFPHWPWGVRLGVALIGAALAAGFQVFGVPLPKQLTLPKHGDSAIGHHAALESGHASTQASHQAS